MVEADYLFTVSSEICKLTSEMLDIYDELMNSSIASEIHKLSQAYSVKGSDIVLKRLGEKAELYLKEDLLKDYEELIDHLSDIDTFLSNSHKVTIDGVRYLIEVLDKLGERVTREERVHKYERLIGLYKDAGMDSSYLESNEIALKSQSIHENLNTRLQSRNNSIRAIYNGMLSKSKLKI